MNHFWKTKEFSKLAKEWEKKLSEDGFEDIEEEKNGKRVLKQDSRYCFRNKNGSEVFMQSKLIYYSLVAEAVKSDDNMSVRDRIIMEFHSEGKPQKEMLAALKEKGIVCHRIVITRTITKYLEKWKIPSKPRKTR